MIARWSGTCDKCGTPWAQGDPIKPRYVRKGVTEDGKPNWVRKPRAYIHERCPKVTPNQPGQISRVVDVVTGEILATSPIPRHTVHQQPALWE